MKILKIKLVGLLTMSLLMSLSSFSQNYENQSPEVKNQMDLNKINGVSIWNDIVISYNVYTEGLNSTNEETILQRAKLQSEILSINVAVNGKFILVCKGGTKFDLVKPIFSNLVTNIIKIEENTYIQTEVNR